MGLKTNNPVRVLYSFPLKLGAGRVCTTAWHQVEGINAAGARVSVHTGCIVRPLPDSVSVRTTLACGKFRIPYRLLGRVGSGALHDWIVARRLRSLRDQIDIVHTWPLAGAYTMKMAARLGIPCVTERCNAHTRYAYKVVQDECRRLGIDLPSDHEHAWNAKVLEKEEGEYDLAFRLLCPSDFVVSTFLKYGFPQEKLKRHIYGFDEKRFYPTAQREARSGLRMISVGVCAVRKGLHFALEAWLKSTACEKGEFLIAGEFLPAYAKKLQHYLSHPSVKVLGHRNDVQDLMRKSDILVLSSIEEGSALVTSEARGCGCVLLVSEASGAVCQHGVNALVHPTGDVDCLAMHITELDNNRQRLEQLRAASLASVHEITWRSAGVRLLQAYTEIVQEFANQRSKDN